MYMYMYVQLSKKVYTCTCIHIGTHFTGCAAIYVTDLIPLARTGSRLPAMNGGHTSPLDGITRRMMALYDYDPAKDSPNANPEEELTFQAGDILLISGQPDSDGFLQVHSFSGYITPVCVPYTVIYLLSMSVLVSRGS